MILELMLMLFAAHWVCDYPLQGDFLSKAKKDGPLRVYHLMAHAGIHAGAVLLITGVFWLALIEWVTHSITDEAKNQDRISFETDQLIHCWCKIGYVFVVWAWLGEDYVRQV